jgi:hypothetical protein
MVKRFKWCCEGGLKSIILYINQYVTLFFLTL